MRKILFITAFPPSENAAAEKNTMLLLEDLSLRYAVDLLYFRDSDKKEYEPPKDSIILKKVVMNSWIFRCLNAMRCPLYHPIFTVRYNRMVKNYIQGLIDTSGYAAIIFDHSQTFMYAKKLVYDGLKVLICHDVEAQRFERTSNKMMAWWCRISEQKVLTSNNANIFSFCQKDVELIRNYYNVDAHLNLDYIDKRITNYTPNSVKDCFVLFGNWSRADNYEGALWLLNGIGDYLKSPIKIQIIGKRFPIEKVSSHPNVFINDLGFVDNPYPIIAESKAMLCPLLSGAGIKVKVIESLASGTPAIGTDIAFEGFDDKYNAFMLKCESFQSFARAIENVQISLHERLQFKEFFIKEYQSMTIPIWLDTNLK